ncbi:hypothetical protein KASHIRA_02350 [Serratia phage vB_SmaM-Kashira]|nr:hypothetical protein KASHIRA_02350 [Serratia phage vB_SmaM-Kashira]
MMKWSTILCLLAAAFALVAAIVGLLTYDNKTTFLSLMWAIYALAMAFFLNYSKVNKPVGKKK